MPSERLNADKPERWKADIAASVDQFNAWFMRFAPRTFREKRVETTQQVREALAGMRDLRAIDAATLRANPAALPTLRMCTAPPLAVDRLIGLAKVRRSLVGRLEAGKLPTRTSGGALESELEKLCKVLSQLLDRDIFPWLAVRDAPTARDWDRAATIVADRLCGATANPIIRNAQEQRQLELIGRWLRSRGYRLKPHPPRMAITDMEPGTYSIRTNLIVGTTVKVNIPIDVVVQPKKLLADRLPILLECKSAGDFTNTNKRRKEEAAKVHQLRATFGGSVCFVLVLCGYFGADYLGYEAAEGIDWVWEHRIDDLARLSL
ncbi:XamI restriction endonuclease [Phycisphaerae bacterium RAS1]|nr:XamI restriction endonuclease [Phycisphaerae bacterium RAS1]